MTGWQLCDNDKSCVHVFSNGEFLHSFGCGEDGEKVLLRPHRVCVAGQYVFVADYGKHCSPRRENM